MEIKKFENTIYFANGSSTGNPDYKGMQTSDIRLWVKLNDSDWFKPYGHFNKAQIFQMINLCETEFQLISLIELLSAKNKTAPTDNELFKLVEKIAYTQTAEQQIDDATNKVYLLREFIENKCF